MRVLQVEDDAATAGTVAFMLKAKGHDCDIVATGEEAVAQAGRADYDMILLDIMLPDIDGFEVLRRLQAADSKVPVMIQSGLIGRDQKVRGLGLGVEAFLVKPFGAVELSDRIEAMLKRAGGAAAEESESFGEPDRRSEPRDDSPVRRQSKRTRTLKSGQIVYNNASCVIECVVKDLSETGAKLEVPDMFECPENVELWILNGSKHRCRLRWQTGKSLGVEFVTD